MYNNFTFRRFAVTIAALQSHCVICSECVSVALVIQHTMQYYIVICCMIY